MSVVAALWKLLIAVRWLWLVAPQSGYIHPDEFFQSPEIIAGDVLQLDTYRSWEFQSVNPVRSTFFPLMTCAPGFYLLRLLHHVLQPNSHLLLVLPRITVALIGLLIDWLVYRMARRMKFNADLVMLHYTSSYVSLVHYTRTLSNTIESFLFVALIYLATVEPRDASAVVNDKKSSLRRKSIHSTKHVTHSDNCFFIGCLIAAGFFNRPTFVCFAAAPYAHWVLFSSYNGRRVLEVCRRLCSSGISAAMTALLFIVCDSVYYGTLSGSSLQTGSAAILKSLTITPWNFLQYNTNSANLAEHGVHPWFTHIAVNLPVLFGLLPLGALRHLTNQPRRLLTMSCFLPVGALSIFPHQEARFLIPLLTPLILANSGLKLGKISRMIFVVFWTMLNVGGCLWFGVIHQGGVTAALSHIQSSPLYDNSHVVFYHTYMPPIYLLSDKRVTIHDLAGGSLSDLSSKVKDVTSDAFLVAPATVDRHFHADELSFRVELLQKFPWHVTAEDWPRYHEDVLCKGSAASINHCASSSMLHNLYNLFSLNLYRITRKPEIVKSNHE